MAKKSVGIDLVGLGKQDGEQVLLAINNGQSVMRDVVTKRAKEFYAIADKAKAWLDGYGEIMGKVRKSEASTIFKALTAGKMDDVESFKGTYHEWITACRKLRDGGTSKSRAGTKHVTGKGFDNIVERVATMSAEQSADLVDKAVMQIKTATPNNWEKTVLQKIEDLAEILKRESNQPFFKELAIKIQSVGAEFLEREAANAAKAKAATHKAPTPAQAAPVEVVEQQQEAA